MFAGGRWGGKNPDQIELISDGLVEGYLAKGLQGLPVTGGKGGNVTGGRIIAAG